MTKSEPRKSENRVWRALSSLKLTFSLLILLALTSIIGTLIPQQEEAFRFARGLSPRIFELFSTLDLFDMYHSTWFRLIIALLILNLIVCSMDRLPGTMKLFRAKRNPDRMKPFEGLPPERSFSIAGEIDAVSGRVERALGDRYKKVTSKRISKGDFFFTEKGRYSYFGVYLVHLSVLLILLGGITGSILGFEAFVNIPEGESIQTVSLRKSGSPKDLGFSVQCEDFEVEFYENGMPREFRSELRFLVDDQEVIKKDLLVNHPVTFQGITFYQSSYGTILDGPVGLKITGPDREIVLQAKKGDSLPLPGGEGHFQILQVEENLRGVMGPAALISVHPQGGEEIRFWVFKQFEVLKKQFPPAMLKAPFLNPSAFEPYTFALQELGGRYYTGLQVSRDPGVPLVWAGCFIMVAGLFQAFFTSHRRIWVRVCEAKNKIEVSVAGRANKNPWGLEKELDQLVDSLRNTCEKRVET